MGRVEAQPCKHPGCSGVIEDGYCNVCGLAETKTRAAAAAGSKTSGKMSAAVSTATGSSPMARGAKGSRRSSRSSSRSTRRNLGAGLISVPELPSTEPEKAILAEPKVPDHKRFCAKCDKALAREKGFCGQCGQKYSFIPTLQPGDTVGGQYEVRGALAYGGLGWIYLAFDRVLSRYVVLKGLLNTEDTSAAAVAVAERQFLAAVKHPNIVGIYNFVQMGTEGFIVMEYVGGKTLRDIRRARGPLPPGEAIAYIHRILSAFSYLHEMKLVYCDFKPENVMLEGDDVKLIDLGGVRRIDDPKGDIYGTEGYSAPEAGEGPTVASDLFTVGRTLAVLLTEMRGFTKEYRYTLPHAADDPVFARQESLFRFLLKATAENPDDRFVSADEMADQLLGVLREVVSVDTGAPHPGNSTLFGGDMLALIPQAGYEPVRPDHRHLPLPVLDLTDPAASLVVNAAASPDPAQRVASLKQIVDLRPKSLEARLRLANALIDTREFPEAEAVLAQIEKDDPWEWRARWYRGRLHMAQSKPKEAQQAFDQVYFDLPGELAPKLGFAMAAEQAGNFEIASHMYHLVARTDPGYASACFGLARCLAAGGDRKGSIAALECIPKTSSLHTRSRVEAARALLGRSRTAPNTEELASASAAIEAISLEGMEKHRIAQMVLEAALELVRGKAVAPNSGVKVLGYPLEENALRFGLEQNLRAMARLVEGEGRVALVDRANAVRPRTLF
jgi:serine/threonine-protein kinase PknG